MYWLETTREITGKQGNCSDNKGNNLLKGVVLL
jgi:hypothetical protein